MKWIVKVLSPRGVPEYHPVEALTPNEAKALLDVPATRIMGVSRDWRRLLKEQLATIHISAFDQATLLSTLSAAALSGQNPDFVFQNFIRNSRSLKKREQEIMNLDRVSARLRLMNLDAQAVVMVEAGEDTGELGQALRRAAKELGYRRKLLAKMKKALILPSIIAVVALGAIVGLPVFFIPLLHDFQSSGIQIQGTIATDIAEVISDTIRNRWFLILIALAAVAVFRKAIWKRLRQMAVFKGVDEYIKCLRAVTFITLFRPLYERGVPVEEILKTQTENASARDRPVYEEMLEEARSGAAFTHTLKREHWPEFMITGLLGFESAIPDAKRTMIESLTDLLVDRVEALGERIGAFLTTTGLALGVAATFMLAFGIYYPIVSASAGGAT